MVTIYKKICRIRQYSRVTSNDSVGGAGVAYGVDVTFDVEDEKRVFE